MLLFSYVGTLYIIQNNDNIVKMEYSFMLISYKHRPVNMTYVKANRVSCCHHYLQLCVYSVYFFQ